MNYSVDNIHKICEVYGITNYTINADGSIDVDGDVNLYRCGLTKLPMKFNHVSGNFNCRWNQLTSLEGSPQSVGDNFNCSWNNLTTLVGTPQSVGGDFECSYNKLTTLEESPNNVGGSFNCDGNPIYDQLGDIDYKSYIKQINRDKILNELLDR